MGDEQGVGAVATNDVDAVLDTDHIESDSVQQVPEAIPIESMVTSEGRITVERAVLDVEVEQDHVAARCEQTAERSQQFLDSFDMVQGHERHDEVVLLL